MSHNNPFKLNKHYYVQIISSTHAQIFPVNQVNIWYSVIYYNNVFFVDIYSYNYSGEPMCKVQGLRSFQTRDDAIRAILKGEIQS